jgi:flagellar M-ring protein FliF
MDPEQLAARMRAITAPFTTGQLVTLVVTFFLVIGLVAGSAYWLSQPTYAVLYSGLDAEDAQAVRVKLDALKVPHEFRDGQIRVPASRIESLKVEFEATGVISGGRQGGVETLTGNSFGQTNVMEKERIRRAQEGEVAKTLSRMDGVAAVRVHIAPGKDVLFGTPQPPTASVFVRLKNGRALPAGSAMGMANVVAAAVGEGIRAEDVSIVDNSGKALTKPRPQGDDRAGNEQLERQVTIERDLAAKAMQLLAPSLGDQVRVTVTAKLTQDSKVIDEVTVDPEKTAVVSQQDLSENQTGGTSPAPAAPAPNVAPGTAGARGNLPAPAPAPATGTAAQQTQQTQLVQGPSSTRTSKNVNQEVSKVTTKTILPPGEIERLTVAVIVDDKRVVKDQNGTANVTRTPRTADELKKIQDMVATAVGLDAMRGDQITVQNMTFQDEPVGTEVEAPGALVRYQPQIEEGARIGGLMLVALLAFLFMVRPLMAKVTGPATPAAAGRGPALPELPHMQRPHTVQELQAMEEARLIEGEQTKAGENVRIKALLKRSTDTAKERPDDVAKVLRNLMAEPGR